MASLSGRHVSRPTHLPPGRVVPISTGTIPSFSTTWLKNTKGRCPFRPMKSPMASSAVKKKVCPCTYFKDSAFEPVKALEVRTLIPFSTVHNMRMRMMYLMSTALNGQLELHFLFPVFFLPVVFFSRIPCAGSSPCETPWTPIASTP